MPRMRARRRPLAVALMFGVSSALVACYNFNITDPNAPVLGDISTHPNRANLSGAMTGLFGASRIEMEPFIWRVGSMGREGINLSGNNQPDYQEPYKGPLSSSQFGGSLWAVFYVQIRDANIIIDATPKAHDLSAAEQSLSIGVAQALKALAFTYIIETRANLGAPVDVDHPPDGTPAPFVTEDSVWATILHTLDSARANLAAGSTANFPFPPPPGFGNASSPQSFNQFVWALTAKAWCMRATATPANAAAYYALALHPAIDSSFLSAAGGSLKFGINYDFSTGSGDVQNGLSEPMNGPIYFALDSDSINAQKQPVAGNPPDQRVLDKILHIPPGQLPQVLGGISIPGIYKFTNYFVGGNANPGAPIPVIRAEELVLLKAEAEIGTGALAAAVTDLNTVRQQSGKLGPYAGAVTTPALITELLYNRRYSLIWEQGTRWIDARRFGLLSTIPIQVAGGNVPTRMPVPTDECNARKLTTPCSPLGT